MRFREDGQLVGINPEYGFFGVAPGTNNKTNPMAMACLYKNTIMTNTAETATGEFFWEGLEDEITDKVTWPAFENTLPFLQYVVPCTVSA